MSAPLAGTAARVEASGKMVPLGPKAQADQTITEADVTDTSKLTKLLVKLLTDVAALRRRFAPRRIDFEDVPVSTAGAAVNLEHGFGGRVRWWIAGWQSSGTAAPILKESTTLTTNSTLSLQSYVAGTATIRVEAAG